MLLLSNHGKPYSRKSIGQRFRKWCDEAGYFNAQRTGCARWPLGACGGRVQQIKAWTGHATDSEVSRYAAAADQQARSDSAGEMLMANLHK